MENKNIKVSVVMPCLNEEETLGTCIEKAQCTLKSLSIQVEVIVADNGSTDDSVTIAKRLRARIVHQPQQGYGAAYLAGIAAAQGRYIIVGDSDSVFCTFSPRESRLGGHLYRRSLGFGNPPYRELNSSDCGKFKIVKRVEV